MEDFLGDVESPLEQYCSLDKRWAAGEYDDDGEEPSPDPTDEEERGPWQPKTTGPYAGLPDAETEIAWRLGDLYLQKEGDGQHPSRRRCAATVCPCVSTQSCHGDIVVMFVLIQFIAKRQGEPQKQHRHLHTAEKHSPGMLRQKWEALGDAYASTRKYAAYDNARIHVKGDFMRGQEDA